MENEDNKIVGDSVNNSNNVVNASDNQSEVVNVPENQAPAADNNWASAEAPTNVEVPVAAENVVEQVPEEDNKKKKKEKKKKKKDEEVVVTSNVADSKPVKIVETSVTQGASGSQVIGSIEGEVVTPNNSPMPLPIDITLKRQFDNSTKIKKVRVVTKAERIISTIVSICVIAILGFAGWVGYKYFYLENPNKFYLKNMKIEIGSELPISVVNYITVPAETADYTIVDDMEYAIDLSSVKPDVVGVYNYSVTHKGIKKTATVTVEDTVAPTIIAKSQDDLIFLKNYKITKEDLVESCEDYSNCTYRLAFTVDTEIPGTKEVKLLVSDDVGNEKEEIITVRVISIEKTLVCTSSEVVSTDNTHKTVNEYTLNFDENDYLVTKSGKVRHTYTDYSAYFAKVNAIENSDSKDDYEIDKINFSYSKATDVETNNLNELQDLVKYYVDNGYHCNEKK